MDGSASTARPARTHLTERLAQDLIGPRSPEETLVSRPSDVWLTGILWPRNTAAPPEEDERLAMASAAGEDDAEDGDAGQPAVVQMRRPSTAGISFAARSQKGIPEVSVRLRFGLYKELVTEGGTVWQRRRIEPEPIMVVLKPDPEKPSVAGGPKGLKLDVRTAAFEGGILATITLVNGSTPSEQGRAALEEATLFQVEMEITAAEGTELTGRPSRRAVVDADDRSAALLYRHAHEFAAGHTCAADWDEPQPGQPDITPAVRITWLPAASLPAVSPDGHEVFGQLGRDGTDPLSAEWLSTAVTLDLVNGLLEICTAYERWIELKAAEAASLAQPHRATADLHLIEARKVLERMRAGAGRIGRDEDAAAAFRLANLAMATQRRWARQPALRWRPFQLGFVLLSLESGIDGAHPDRGVMDLLWFPTGGGKTEAYLAIVALVAFHRRLSRTVPDDGAGIAVIMRYTLRLLTTQQFIRASAMICACEAIRRGRIAAADQRNMGSRGFSIGLWVGEGATPNKRKDAFDSKSDRNKASPKQLVSCPCCHEALDYVQEKPADPVLVYCRNAACLLSGSAPLPVCTVDEDVYAFRPTLLIGTVDKFAQIVRNPRTAALFAVGTGAQPQLILQDELHLISGPLGTVSGLYETAIDIILSADGSRPKIIGSTATIRRASEQVLALFDRETCQFPPPGLDADDSGFAVVDRRAAAPARLYLGVSTAGRSAKYTLQAVSASLLVSASSGLTAAERDHYWTLLAYFNSLRELGGALVLMQDDVNDSIQLLAAQRGEAPRRPSAVEELTSRRSQQEIRKMLDDLEIPSDQAGALDVVLATNMVSVGVDISRLGLMLVNGQPKTMAEYIQATSRVGRGRVAGLVVPVLNAAKPRDRSHFETFRTWHATLYREVEATSVTPFASRARDRALHAVLVAVARHLAPGMLAEPQLTDAAVAVIETLIEKVAARASRIDPLETDVRSELRQRLARWQRRNPVHYWRLPPDSLLQAAEAAAARRAAGRLVGQAWPTPNTMRGVEPSTPFRLTRLKRGS